MTLAAHMLADDALRATPAGFDLDVHLTWYRSLPLSSVRTVELAVNGERIPGDDITFVLGGTAYALDDLQEHWDEIWFVLDPATLRVRGHAVDADADVDVTVRLGNRIPYILIGPDRALEVLTESSRRLVAR